MSDLVAGIEEEEDVYLCVGCEEIEVPPDGPSYCQECLDNPRRVRGVRFRKMKRLLDGARRRGRIE